MSRHRMAPGDAAWLHMDRPTNRMIVNSVMWFDDQLDWSRVRDLLQERLVAKYPRFSQRVEHRLGVPWWVDDENFDIDDHLYRAALPEPGGHRELEEYVGSLVHRSLPPELPLWELHFVDGYGANGCAVVSRMHHCIADGVALSRVFLSLTDDPAAAAGAHVEYGEKRSLAGQLVDAVKDSALHPQRAVARVGGALATAGELGRLVLLPADRRTALRRDVGVRKQVAWSDPLDVAELRGVAHELDATVNDLVLTAVAGALRQQLGSQAADLRAILPVDLRDGQQPLPRDLGNRFGLIFATLPLTIDDPLDRLAEIHRRTGALKHSHAADGSFALLDIVGRTPTSVEQLLVGPFAAKGSAVITNVVGPRQPVLLAGCPVRGLLGWPPESGGIALGMSIISYDGRLVVGVLADERVVPRPRRLLAGVLDQLDELRRCAREADGASVASSRAPTGRKKEAQA